MFSAIQADKILEDQVHELEDQLCFGLQGDGSHDKARKPQEAVNVRVIDKQTGRPKIMGLGFTKLSNQNATSCRSAMFSVLQKHGVSKELAHKKMVSVGVDGAAVNLGNFKGLKALITKTQGDPGTDPSLEYWAWSWVLLIHCINHLLELGIGDLKDADPYVEVFNEQLQKIFKVYYYSSTMESAREEMALLSDDDFTTLGGLNQIRWAPSQHRALIKLDKNYTNLTKHIEHVAASTRHDRKAECEGILGFATSLKFLKMMMFMIDLHSILKVVSLCFQKEEILIIEVEPILQKAFTAIENLRGGKGLKMLHFADNFQETGTYKGLEINRT